MDWEHVSVSLQTVPETARDVLHQGFILDGEDVVIQYHREIASTSIWHENCLHLWRPVGVEIPTPPRELVG